VTIFNRLLIIVLAVAVLVGAGAVVLTALGVLQPANVAPAGPWFVDRLATVAQLDSTPWMWALGISVGLIVLALVVLVLEVWPRSRAPQRLVLKDDEVGQVTVVLDGVRELVEREAVRVAGVQRARAQVLELPTGLQISCRVSVDPEVSVPEMSNELRQRLKTSVERHVGLTVRRVSVDAQVAPVVIDQRHRRRVQ
jgi:hypothetical protein